MLTNLFELLILRVANRRGRSRPDPLDGQPAATTRDGRVLIGHLIPDLGDIDASPVAATLTPEERLRHIYILGATGTGKTNLVMRLIESDIASERTFCVVDLRGDLTDRVLLHLARQTTPETLGERLVLIDLKVDDYTVGINPLVGPGEPYARAFHVLSVLRKQSDSWGVQLEDTLRNVLVALAEYGGSMLDIEPILTRKEFRERVLASVTDPMVHGFFQRYEQLSDEKRMTWVLPVLNKVAPFLAMPILRRTFGHREPLSIRELLDGKPGRVILVSLAIDRTHQAAHLVGGLFVSMFQTAVMARAGIPECERIPVHLYIDEFETMATDQFEVIVAEGRRFGLGLCLSHQNLSQLPTCLRHVLRNNVHAQFLFQTGAVDAAELDAEVSTDTPKEVVRRLLIRQPVGEAFLIRRGQDSRRVRVLHCPDPVVDAASIQAIREHALETHGRRAADIDLELDGREPHRGLPPCHERQSLPPIDPDPTLDVHREVRHARKPGQFRPL